MDNITRYWAKKLLVLAHMAEAEPDFSPQGLLTAWVDLALCFLNEYLDEVK